MTTTTRPRLVKIEDHEGYGICHECRREGLRWVAVLSDGTQVGTECAKRVLGFKLAPKDYNWAADFTPVAEYVDCGDMFVLWQHKQRPTLDRSTLNGRLFAVNGVRAEWQRRGWL
jgi:hypothetical protein